MKKLFSLVLCFLAMISALTIISSANGTISPYHNNVSTTNTSFKIVEDDAVIDCSYFGYIGTTTRAEISVTLYHWIDNDWGEVVTWYDESTRYRGNFNYTIEVESGTYKVFVEYRIYGSGGDADVITYEKELTN